MAVILGFLVAHWVLSIFFQSFFLHRYSAHRMFTMSKGWEKVFYVCTWIFQGSSYLPPRAYALLHREHHAYSDGPKDPHSPHLYPSVWSMMKHTKKRFEDLLHRRAESEARFEGGYPEWKALDRMGDSWITRGSFIAAYVLFYVLFAPHWAFFLLLPVHFMMGPIQGALVNWCGHMYGYRNFKTHGADRSRNTLPLDVLAFGELFQNNHHTYGMSPNFAVRWFEFDPTWWVIRGMSALGIVRLSAHTQKPRWPHRALASQS